MIFLHKKYFIPKQLKEVCGLGSGEQLYSQVIELPYLKVFKQPLLDYFGSFF
jgi:hypothetical protein